MRKRLLGKLPDSSTVVAFIGFAALIFGIWQIHRPSAWIAAGMIVIAYSVLATAAKKRIEIMQRRGDRE